MNYMAVKVNANYNIEKDKITISLRYIDSELQNISEQYLEIKEGIRVPKYEVVEQIKQYYTEEINKNNVKNIVENSVDSYTGEYSVFIGTVSLTEDGKIYDINHRPSYKFVGESSKYMNQILDKYN